MAFAIVEWPAVNPRKQRCAQCCRLEPSTDGRTLSPELPVLLRRAYISEIMEVADLRSRVFPGDGNDIMRRRRIHDAILARINTGGVACLVALCEGLIVGTVDGALYDRRGRMVSITNALLYPTRKLLYVSSMGVDERFRKLGIGRKLLNGAVRVGEELKAESVYLHVEEENKAAERMYESSGFQRITDPGDLFWINRGVNPGEQLRVLPLAEPGTI